MNKDEYIKQLESQIVGLEGQIQILNKDNLETLERQKHESYIANCFRKEVRAVLSIIDSGRYQKVIDKTPWFDQARALMVNYKDRHTKFQKDCNTVTEEDFQKDIEKMVALINEHNDEK